MTKGRRFRNKKDSQKKHDTDKNEKEKCDENEIKIVPIVPSIVEENFNNLFRVDELTELKKILNTQDLSETPLLICAVVLGKFDLVKKLLKDGHHINNTDSNFTTPIVWAIKTKNLEMTDMLLARGADVTIPDKNGDNGILLAIDSAMWDEHAFINFWNGIKNHSRFDINYANKSGNTILHFAVKRQWSNLVELLIDSEVNVNATNTKGVTALMMAGARNNALLIEILLRAQANIAHEDDRGCTALCYTIAYVIQKRIDPLQSKALEKLISIINNGDTDLTPEEYLRRRVKLIITPIGNEKYIFPNVISTIILPVFTFFIRHTHIGLEILLELNIFSKLREALEKHINFPEYVNVILACTFEMVRFCQCCVRAGELVNISEKNLMDTFVTSGGADMCLNVLKRFQKVPNNGWIVVSALMPIFMACVSEGKSQLWLQMHYFTILPFYKQFLEMCVVSFNFIADDYHIKLVKRKVRAFRTLMIKLQNDKIMPDKKSTIKYEASKQYIDVLPLGNIQSQGTFTQEREIKEIVPENDAQRKLVTLDEFLSIQETQKAIECKSNSKRMKRKTKAWKAKIAKIRSADVAERVISKSDLTQNNLIMDMKKTEDLNHGFPVAECNPKTQNVENSNWNTVGKGRNRKGDNKDTIKIDIKLEQDSSSEEVISDAESEERQMNTNNMDIINIQVLSEYSGYFNEEIETTIVSKVQCLTFLFEDIVARYERNWRTDRELGYPDYKPNNQSISGDRLDTICSREEKIKNLSEILPQLEAVYLARLREKFMEVIARIKQLAYYHDIRCQQLIEQLQVILLNHEIRGETLLKCGWASKNYNEHIENNKWKNNCADNDFKEKDDECIKQMMNVSKTRKEDVDAIKQKTEESAYHLIESVERLLDSSTSVSSKDDGSECEHTFDELFPYSMETLKDDPRQTNDKLSKQYNEETTNSLEQSKLKSQDMCASSFFNILSNSKARRSKSTEETNDTFPNNNNNNNNNSSAAMNYNKYQTPGVPSQTNNAFWKKSQLPIPIPGQQSYISRWDVSITNLRNYKNLTILACGELRTSPKNARLHFMVSSGGNFGDVELGLDIHCRALAVKRISKQNNVVCKILKTAMNPLLGLRHKHLLHYAVCDYDDTQLLIASPLCEYNMGEYLMCLKLNHSLVNTATSLARQMLIGLRYLHERTQPIVHGNLKPSNVLIDSSGVLKLAEFGVYRALYQTVRPPKSSIIWFARETYEHYEKTSIMSCTTYSDIQVAGMLLHFILTGGLHPFGIVAENILENIVRGTPDLKTVECELVDLVSWMLIYEPSERPTVSQVLSHVYFWDSERKWRFLLACAGITQHGSPIPVSLNHLHSTLDASAARDHIKGDWVSVVKAKFPGMRLSEATFSDTPTGLLRFLRACTEERQLNNRSLGGIDLQCFFIEAFPALPLSLFRLLETSEWLKHPVFSPFTIATS